MTIGYRQTCAWTDCDLATTGKSKYCRDHKRAARAAWKVNIGLEKIKRQTQHAEIGEAFNKAHLAGKAAGDSYTPTPMTVYTPKGLFDDTPDPTKPTYYVSEGVCGFAWIVIKPGNSAPANYAKEYLGASKHYYGGVCIWVRSYGQSYERKNAYAGAFAEVLQAELHALGFDKVTVYSDSRLD